PPGDRPGDRCPLGVQQAHLPARARLAPAPGQERLALPEDEEAGHRQGDDDDDDRRRQATSARVGRHIKRPYRPARSSCARPVESGASGDPPTGHYDRLMNSSQATSGVGAYQDPAGQDPAGRSGPSGAPGSPGSPLPAGIAPLWDRRNDLGPGDAEAPAVVTAPG